MSVISKLRHIPDRIMRKFEKSRFDYLRECKGVIHVGAHEGQERDSYAERHLRVVWIECNPEVFVRLKRNVADYPDQVAIHGLASDRDGVEYDFNISSNDGGSSSVLEPALHLELFPSVAFVRQIKLVGHTLPTLLAGESINLADYDSLTLDTQGTELQVLQGAESILQHFRFIKAEAADFESYKGCCKVDELDAFLVHAGFTIEHKWLNYRGSVGSYYDVLWRRLAL